MSKELAEEAHRRAYNLFTWVADEDNPFFFKNGVSRNDVWHSFIDKYHTGKKFSGDCDDFALTCADALREKGVSPTHLRLAICTTETDVLHAVLIVDKKWLVDNRFDYVVGWDSAPYTWESGMDCDKPGEWFKL